MRSLIHHWKETLAKRGFKVRKQRKPRQLRERRLQFENLERKELLTTVSVALGQNAIEGSQTGYATFTRDNTSGSLTVMYEISGTAGYYTDYSSPSTRGSVTFGLNQNTVNLNVVPVDDAVQETNETVVVTILDGEPYHLEYDIGTPSATVLIIDNDSPSQPTVSVAVTQNAAEPSQNGVYTFTRTTTSGSLTVNYAIDTNASTASYSSDYSAPATSGTVTFPVG